MVQRSRRPFYGEFAWAFDLLVDRPVRKECAEIAAWLVERSVRPGATMLDAGCGTGRYSIELARRGYVVHGVDLSPELVAVAGRASAGQPGSVTFAVADILAVPDRHYDAILCRGVLNDIIDDDRRDAVFAAFARALRPDGVLVLDVREWRASEERKRREPLFRKRVSTDRGELTFTSITELDREHRRLVISEQHALADRGVEQVADYRFVMRCWERDELAAALDRHGFERVMYRGAYDRDVGVEATDRIVAVAQLAAGAPRALHQARSHGASCSEHGKSPRV
jgi:SAM-dependent methyltransferase